MSTPTRAILRETVAIRCVLVLTAALLAAIAYASTTSREQPGGFILALVVVPIFAVMLGAALGAGQHASWAWALARPISRRRWLLVHVAVDAATVAASLAAAWLVLGRMVSVTPVMTLVTGEVIVGEDPAGFELPSVSIAVSTVLYCCAAVGTARGHNAVRAVLSQMVGPAVALTLLWCGEFAALSSIESVEWTIHTGYVVGVSRTITVLIVPLGVVAVILAQFRVFALTMAAVPVRLPLTATVRAYAICISPVLAAQLVVALFTLIATDA